jgi:hypothetical protein
VICREREREENLLNVTVLVVRVWGGIIERGNNYECYCFCCEGVGRGI